MKKLHFLSLAFIFLAQVSMQGQQVVRKYFTHTEVDGTQNFKKYEYKYDTEGHLIEEIVLQKKKMTSFFELKTKKDWSYQGDDLLMYRIYEWSFLMKEWKIKEQYESIYDDGCLDKQIKTKWGAFGVEKISKLGIENDYDCSIGWKNESYWLLKDFIPTTKIRRGKTDSSELQVFQITKDMDIIEMGRQEMICNADGQLLRYYNTYTNSAYAHLYSYTYNEEGRLIKRRWFTKTSANSEWLQKSKTITEYTYDLSTLIQKRVRINEYNNGNIYSTQLFIYDYSYYCDGLLKEKKWTNEHKTESSSAIYEYETPSDCGNYKFTVLKTSPNPFENKILVESDLLNDNGAVINVYNILGELLYQKILVERVNKIEIEIKNATEQVLILQIKTNNHQISKKILRLN